MTGAMPEGGMHDGVAPRLRTTRLTLVPGSLALSEAELNDPGRFQQLLGAAAPEWPPPLNDERSIRYMRDYFAANPGDPGWAVWYFLLPRDGAASVAIGNGGFKGVPDAEGTVEVGYSVLETYQGAGYATEAVGALVEWAFGHPEVARVIAETFPELVRSIRVLEKLGFRCLGPGSEAGVIRFERLRPGAVEGIPMSGIFDDLR